MKWELEKDLSRTGGGNEHFQESKKVSLKEVNIRVRFISTRRVLCYEVLIDPVRNDALLGFEPFDSAHGPEDVEGSERPGFLTGLMQKGGYR